MRTSILLIPLLVAGCDRAVNSFEIRAPEAASAELQLCGQTTKLERVGEKLVAKRGINCEGEGDIMVHLPNGPSVSCHIGYVTPGAVQSFQFKIEDGQCSSDLKSVP